LEIEISYSQWEGSACTHERSSFFLLREGEGEFFIYFSLVPNVFPSSQSVPKCFPQDAPNSTWLLSQWFTQSSTSLYINYNPKIMLASILQPEVHLLGAVPNLPRKLLMGKSIWVLFKERKSCEHTHDLTNMNHTIPRRDKPPNCMMSLALA
jgi:hypothetical protein